MRGFSKAILAGNLTRDPEVRTTPNGAQVTGFSIAVNRVWKDQNGNQQEAVSFFDCSAWGKMGETIAQWAKKGSGVIVSGRLEQHSWDDKTTGQKRSRVELTVEDFSFVGGRNDNGGGSSAGYEAGANAGAGEETVPVDIPDNLDLNEIPF